MNKRDRDWWQSNIRDGIFRPGQISVSLHVPLRVAERFLAELEKSERAKS